MPNPIHPALSVTQQELMRAILQERRDYASCSLLEWANLNVIFKAYGIEPREFSDDELERIGVSRAAWERMSIEAVEEARVTEKLAA